MAHLPRPSARAAEFAKEKRGRPFSFETSAGQGQEEHQERGAFSFLRLFRVFNISQIEGLTLVEQDKQPLPVHERNARSEAFLKATGGENTARRRPRTITTRPTTMCSYPSCTPRPRPVLAASRSTNSGTGREQAPGSDRFPPGLVMRAEYAFEELVRRNSPQPLSMRSLRGEA